MSPLTGWENFYVIMGSSAGALTGLMFVVITLIVGIRERDTNNAGGGDVAAYGTPNVVHFCVVLLICAMLAAPWESLHVVGVLLVITGVGGVAYAAIILRRMIRRARLESSYTPVLEDWLWFGLFPFISYAALVVAALIFLADPTVALYIVAAALALLLVIGIHNAWDTVTFIAIERYKPQDERDTSKSKKG